MSMLTLDDLRRRCIVDPVTRCWHWQGAADSDGSPRIHTLDYARAEKRTMSGPLAAFQIAHQRAPIHGWRIYRCCGTRDCLSPQHLSEVRSTAEMGRRIADSGRRKGIPASPAKLAAAARGRAAQGYTDTPRDVVLQIRAAPAEVTNRSLAAQFGLSEQRASKIRRGESHKNA